MNASSDITDKEEIASASLRSFRQTEPVGPNADNQDNASILQDHGPVKETAGSPSAGPGTRARKTFKVRPMEECDREAIRAVLRAEHAHTVFRNQPFSDWKYDRHVNTVLSRPPRMICLVVERNDAALGVAWASADSYMLSDGPIFVTVTGIAVEMEKLGAVSRAKAFVALIRGIKHWANSLNATHAFIHVTTGSNLKATDKLIRAAGGNLVGGAYLV